MSSPCEMTPATDPVLSSCAVRRQWTSLSPSAVLMWYSDSPPRAPALPTNSMNSLRARLRSGPRGIRRNASCPMSVLPKAPSSFEPWLLTFLTTPSRVMVSTIAGTASSPGSPTVRRASARSSRRSGWSTSRRNTNTALASATISRAWMIRPALMTGPGVSPKARSDWAKLANTTTPRTATVPRQRRGIRLLENPTTSAPKMVRSMIRSMAVSV